jgi:hypothetical protein
MYSKYYDPKIDEHPDFSSLYGDSLDTEEPLALGADCMLVESMKVKKIDRPVSVNFSLLKDSEKTDSEMSQSFSK